MRPKSFMKFSYRAVAFLILLCGLFAASLFSFKTRSQTTEPRQIAPVVTPATREEAYRENNRGVAMLEQYNHKEAAEAFRRALKIDPELRVALINRAIALYNVPDLDEASRAVTVAAERAPQFPQPHYIAGLIAKAQNRTDDAVASFTRVLAIDAQDVGANVNLGQLYAQGRKYAEAVAAFRRALAVEPYNTTAIYNLALASQRAGNREEGTTLLARFQELRQSGAGTSIGQNYLEQGRYAEGIVSVGAEADLVRTETPNVTFADASTAILPPAVTGNRRAAAAQPAASGSTGISPLTPDGRLTEAARRAVAASHGGGVTLFDLDADGDLDLFEITSESQKLHRNDGGKYTDITETSGLAGVPDQSVGIGAVAADFDNDNRIDLFVLRYGSGKPGVLYRNEGNNRFSDVSATAEFPAYTSLAVSAALVDVEHDGDLDIFIVGFADLTKPTTGDAKRTAVTTGELAAAPNMLLRNNGDGKFTDITQAAKVAGGTAHGVAVVPTDYDNRRDVDLLVVNYGAPPILYRNLRDRTFRDVAPEVGLTQTGRYTCAAAGDLNKDGFTDFFFGRAGEPSLFALSDGQGKFRVGPVSDDASSGDKSAPGSALVAIDAAQIFDYDGDGLLDTVAVSDKGLRVWRNVGNDFTEVSERVLPAAATPPSDGGWWARKFAAGDIDADGDTDLILRLASGALRVGRNDGGNRNRSIRIQLAGRVSNRSGVAAKVEMRAGSLWQKLETYAASPAPAPADLVFGLGARALPDAVRVIWASGVVQAETEMAANANEPKAATTSGTPATTTVAARTLSITELDRKPSSCPFLYTWNGNRFEFITDMMGGGEMGAFVGENGQWNTPDPDEYVRISGDKLKERGGRYELRITNELEETLFMDQVQLIAIAHPNNVEVYPNEGLGNPTAAKHRLYSTREPRPPVSAVDDDGRDMLPQLAQVDRRYPDTFKLMPIRGYAEPHTLTLDFGASASKNSVLLMTAWTDYAFSSDNVAAAQRGLSQQFPSLQVRDAKGEWQTVIENVGLPVGRPQTVVVNLTGKFLTDNREVRIVTNMRIYWDQILVAETDKASKIQRTTLDPTLADLRWRGFSAEVMPDGREPILYDYERVSTISPWKVFPGRYTREGDVRALLARTDDMFVVSRPGDVIELAFHAQALPQLPANWTRTFLLYVDGFSKEMDINSATPDQLAPFPFHGMTRYPYNAPETYPDTPAHRDYLERYNTRIVTAPIRTLK